jgi:hypothetical protein
MKEEVGTTVSLTFNIDVVSVLSKPRFEAITGLSKLKKGF